MFDKLSKDAVGIIFKETLRRDVATAASIALTCKRFQKILNNVATPFRQSRVWLSTVDTLKADCTNLMPPMENLSKAAVLTNMLTVPTLLENFTYLTMLPKLKELADSEDDPNLFAQWALAYLFSEGEIIPFRDPQIEMPGFEFLTGIKHILTDDAATAANYQVLAESHPKRIEVIGLIQEQELESRSLSIK